MKYSFLSSVYNVELDAIIHFYYTLNEMFSLHVTVLSKKEYGTDKSWTKYRSCVFIL